MRARLRMTFFIIQLVATRW